MTTADLTLYYAPRTRSFTALWLLEEFGLDYALESFDLSNRRHKQPDYLALNPLGKVPMLLDRGRAVPEIGAIAIYLSDLYPAAKLAPAPDEPKRPDFLRWIFFASAIIEPSLGERMFGWTPAPSSLAWGSFDEMIRVATEGLSRGNWLLGDTFSAADVLVGAGLRFGMLFGAIPVEGPIADYVARCTARDAFKRAEVIEAREGERFPYVAPQPKGSDDAAGGAPNTADEDATARAEQDSRVDYIEFSVASIERSRAFYGEAFGWSFTDYGPTYCAFSDGRLEGGFAQTSSVQAAGGALVIIYADALEQTLANIESAGGQIVQPIYDFPGGRRFHFTDPDGYELAVWSAR